MDRFAPEHLLERAAAILKEEGATAVYAFGSFARGTAGPASDLDLAVSGLASDRVIPVLARLLTETGYMVDLLQVEREEEFVQFLRSRGELRRVA